MNILPNNPTGTPNSINPFQKFCVTIGAIPTSYKTSLSYEEQLFWFCDFLENTVIPALNHNAEVVEELQNLYIELKNYLDNYFKNLDLQEEVNQKLDEMAEDGTLENLFTPFFNFNDYIQPLFGINFATYNVTDIMARATNTVKCADRTLISLYSTWDSTEQKFNLRADYYTPEEHINALNEAGSLFNENNINIKAIKFHTTPKINAITGITPETLIAKYKDLIDSTLTSLTFDYDSIIILNEDDVVENVNYETAINNLITDLKTTYAKPISISKNGIHKINSMLPSIRNNQDYFSFNSYGDYSIEGETTTLENIVNHYDDIATECLALRQEKPIILTEFGCRDSWESFHNAGSDYTSLGIAKPPALVIEAFFKTRLSCYLNDAYLWYSSDAMRILPNLLKNIKKGGAIRHG